MPTRIGNLTAAFAASFLFVVNGSVISAELGTGFSCHAELSPEKLVLGFRERGIIEKAPYSTVDAVHSYASQPGHTVFGFPFTALIAWEEDSKFFGRGPGTSPGTVFSLVVRANQWQLENAVRKNGIKFSRGRAELKYPDIRVSGFNSDSADDLPKSADQRFAYAQLTCRPRE